jgi:hypothetical protein
MATRQKTSAAIRDRGRIPYRFTAAQVQKMIEAGVLAEGDDVELWDGVLYKMVKGELHHFIASQVADALRRLAPAGYHVREEKSSAFGERSLPEPDVALCRGQKGDYLPHPPQLARLAPSSLDPRIGYDKLSARAALGPKRQGAFIHDCLVRSAFFQF